MSGRGAWQNVRIETGVTRRQLLLNCNRMAAMKRLHPSMPDCVPGASPLQRTPSLAYDVLQDIAATLILPGPAVHVWCDPQQRPIIPWQLLSLIGTGSNCAFIFLLAVAHDLELKGLECMALAAAVHQLHLCGGIPEVGLAFRIVRAHLTTSE